MNIQNHIKSLLYRHDCVMVKGLGGFVCQRQSAQIKDDYFIPPQKILTFNQSLNQSDGLLANHIAKEEKVSFHIAEQKIQNFSQKIFDVLEEEDDVYLKDLGHFKINAEHKLIFEPDTQNQWLIEAYGLPKFKINALPVEKSEPQKTVAAAKVEREPQVKSITDSKDSKPKPAYWKYAAVGVIAIGIAGLIGSQVYKQDIKAHNIAEQEKANQLVEQKIQQSSFMLNSPLKSLSIELINPEPVKKGKYHIVGGAFRVRANVDKKIKQLRRQGFDAKYIGTNAYGLHQVVYESFENKTEALKKLRQIKVKNNPSAWLFVKEL